MSNQGEVRVFRASRPSWRTPAQLFLIALMVFAGTTMLNAGTWTLLCPTPFLVLGATRVWRIYFQNEDRIEVDSDSIRDYIWKRKIEIRWEDVQAFGWLDGTDAEIYPILRAHDGTEIYLWPDQDHEELIRIISERTGLPMIKDQASDTELQ